MKSLFAILMLGLALPALAAKPGKPPDGMLPMTAEPLAYTLHFDIDPAAEGFDGSASIVVRLNTPASFIWLNGKGLVVSSASIKTASGELPARYTQVNKDGLARVDFGKTLAAQKLTLNFQYRASYAADLEGLYKVKRGSESYAMTQFETLGARKAFPSFDEPRFKTPFTVSMTVPKEAVAVANTHQLSEVATADGRRTVNYAPTENLPTYLLALAVGPWAVSETLNIPANAQRTTSLPLRVFGPKGSEAKLGYALSHTPALVTALEAYFDIAYPFDKLDLLAAPDFAAGAMENAGLITFADSLILVDENSSLAAIKSYTEVTTHELAHQWFGNLVTPHWWDDIWLNEAFATWMAAKIVTQVAPEQRADLDQLRSTQYAMGEDSLVSARQIREPIRTLGDIDAAFDGITYQKGSGVLSTFESWIGAENFRRGVHAHMLKHARGVATADDLIGALAAASDKGAAFAPAMRSFLDQPGLPLVATTPQCKAGKGSLLLKQDRYLPLGSPGDKPGKGWQIPVCAKFGFADGSSTQSCTLLDAPQKTLALEQCPLWVMPNAKAGGYYRFSLPPADFQALFKVLPTLTPMEQLAVTDAVTGAFRQGKLHASDVLSAMQSTAQSPLPQVALAMRNNVDFLGDQVLDAKGRDGIRAQLWVAYESVIERLTLTPKAGESSDDKDLRARLVSWLAMKWQLPVLSQSLLALAEPIFAAEAQRPKLDTVSEDLLVPVISVWARTHGATAAARLKAELLLNTDPAERRAMLRALGAIEEPVTAAALRDFALTPTLQLQEMQTLLDGQGSNQILKDSYWLWFQSRFADFLKRLPGLSQSYLVDIGATHMCSKPDITKLGKFFDPQRLASISGGARKFKTATETIGVCSALAQHNAK